ncbi:hypothetical protein RFF05_02920 [Bengtsoniella intestinalis]|uniref:hypothetical protein n=1 Tax=Bengtsoniella intestinalis TaxID=3073143 RepID=UPI00391F8F87
MKLEHYVPVGRDYLKDLKYYFLILLLATGTTISFFPTMLEEVDYIIQGRYNVMPPYVEILGTRLWVFPILALFCLVNIAFYYQMHIGSSRSIYLMRRLPDRWSLLRRCVVLPMATAALTMVVAGLLLLLYHSAYYSMTPEGYYQEGQWRMLWDAWTA